MTAQPYNENVIATSHTGKAPAKPVPFPALGDPMNAISLVRYIVDHPLNADGKFAALRRFLRWQIASRLIAGPIAVPYVNGTRLLMRRNMTGATGNWYCGLHEHGEMAFLLHALRPGDLFVDIGANVGSYTVLAAGAVGAGTVTVEPIPSTFEFLQDNIRINRLENLVEAHRIGLSGEPGELRFTTRNDTTNHVAADDEPGETTTVPVTTLDALMAGRTPTVMKIDVEGHEAKVLAGARAVLDDPGLAAVIMETNSQGLREGVTRDVLIDVMEDHGFRPFSYDPFTRTLREGDGHLANTIFLREPGPVQARCKAAPRYNLLNGSI